MSLNALGFSNEKGCRLQVLRKLSDLSMDCDFLATYRQAAKAGRKQCSRFHAGKLSEATAVIFQLNPLRKRIIPNIL
jgi:hypothetical protein